MSAFDRIAGYKKEKEELMALAEIFKNRKKYELYDNKLSDGDESAQSKDNLSKRIEKIGYIFQILKHPSCKRYGNCNCHISERIVRF